MKHSLSKMKIHSTRSTLDDTVERVRGAADRWVSQTNVRLRLESQLHRQCVIIFHCCTSDHSSPWRLQMQQLIHRTDCPASLSSLSSHSASSFLPSSWLQVKWNTQSVQCEPLTGLPQREGDILLFPVPLSVESKLFLFSSVQLYNRLS